MVFTDQYMFLQSTLRDHENSLWIKTVDAQTRLDFLSKQLVGGRPAIWMISEVSTHDQRRETQSK